MVGRRLRIRHSTGSPGRSGRCSHGCVCLQDPVGVANFEDGVSYDNFEGGHDTFYGYSRELMFSKVTANEADGEGGRDVGVHRGCVSSKEHGVGWQVHVG